MLVLAVIAVWAVRLEAKQAEAELLAKFQDTAGQEADLWDLERECFSDGVPDHATVLLPREVFAAGWRPQLEIPDAGDLEPWHSLLQRFEEARRLRRKGDTERAAMLLRELRADEAVAEARSPSGLPLLALVLRAQLDVEPAHRRDEIARELVTHAFAEPSPISRKLVADAGEFWREKCAIFDLLESPGCSWSSEQPWCDYSHRTWFADFSGPAGMVKIVSLEDVEKAVQVRQSLTPGSRGLRRCRGISLARPVYRAPRRI